MSQNTFATLFVLVAFCFFEWFVVFPQTKVGNQVSFSVDRGNVVTITGVETVNVTATSDSYFRIYAGNSKFIADPTGDQSFSQTGTLPAQGWRILDANEANVTISAPSLISVSQEYSNGAKIALTIILLILAAIIWIFIATI